MNQGRVLVRRLSPMLGVVLVALVQPALAEFPPTAGTHRNVYEVNRAGVGRFGSFIVPRRLLEQMAPYKDKYVEVEVLEARSVTVPGPSMIEKIGKVTVLEDTPVEMRLKVIAPGTGGEDTVDVLYSVANVGKPDVVIDANYLSVGIQRYVEPEGPEEQDRFLGTGYTVQQLAYRVPIRQQWGFLGPTRLNPGGEPTSFFTGEVRLRPGETAPFVLHGLAVEPGEYEAVAQGSIYLGREAGFIPFRTSQIVQWPSRSLQRMQRSTLRAEVRVTRDGEWFLLEGRLLPRSDEPAFIFARSQEGSYFLPGEVRLYDASGELVNVWLDWLMPDGPWVRTEVGRDGLPFAFRVRKSDFFSLAVPTAIALWTVTDHGVEKLTLADSLPQGPARAEAPWGGAVEGCALRIQTAKESFRAGEKVRFYYQAQSDGTQADILWIDRGHSQSHCVVTVNGKRARHWSGGLTSEGVYRFPFQGPVTLDPLEKFPPGTYKLQFSVTGDPGTYIDLRGGTFRQFNGTLVSNFVEFEVTEE
jgi:hypothetical protein